MILLTIFLWSPTILPWTQFPISPYLVSLNPEEDVQQVPLLCLECVLFDLFSLDEFSSKSLSALPFGTTPKPTSEYVGLSHWSEAVLVLFSSSAFFLSQIELTESPFGASMSSSFLFDLDNGAPGTLFTGIFSGPILLSGKSASSVPYNYFQLCYFDMIVTPTIEHKK